VKKKWLTAVYMLLAVCLIASTASARVPDDSNSDHSRMAPPAIKVDCNTVASISATLAHLAQIGSTRDITVVVNGTCKENITISGFDHLVLKSFGQGTTLQDASNGSNTVAILSSFYDVTLEGFIINGGVTGV